MEVNLKEGEERPEQHLDDGEFIERVIVPLDQLYDKLQGKHFGGDLLVFLASKVITTPGQLSQKKMAKSSMPGTLSPFPTFSRTQRLGLVDFFRIKALPLGARATLESTADQRLTYSRFSRKTFRKRVICRISTWACSRRDGIGGRKFWGRRRERWQAGDVEGEKFILRGLERGRVRHA